MRAFPNKNWWRRKVVKGDFSPGGGEPVLLNPAESAVFVSIGLPPGMAGELAGRMPVRTLGPQDLTRNEMEALCIGAIACPLMDRDCDAITVIESLLAAGYEGTLTVIAPPLPNVRMVEKELRAAAGPLTIRLLTL